MRLVFSCILAFSILGQGEQGLAAGGDGWAGFWRLEQKNAEALPRKRLACPLKCAGAPPGAEKGQKDPIFHLWVSSTGGLHFFDAEWTEIQLAPGSGSEADTLKLVEDFRAGHILWTGHRDGDSLQGNWKFLHFQYPTEGSFSGRRDSSKALKAWHPGDAARASTSAEGILNLAALLHEEAGDADGFRDYVENEFVPQFLPFLRDWPGASQLRTTLDSNQEMAVFREFEAQAANLQKLLHRNFPEYQPPFVLVITPSGDQPEQAFVADRRFLLINPRRFVKGIEKDKMRVSEKILQAQLDPFTRSFRSGGVFEIGLRLFLLDRAYPEELPEVMGVTQARLEQLREQLPEIKQKMIRGHEPEGDAGRYLGLSFFRALSTGYSFEEIVSARPDAMVKRLVEYLQVTSEVSPPGSPARDTESEGTN